MTALQNLARAGFDGIAFPVANYEVTGGIRDHIHTYPHSPGGAAEKLGRELYRVRYSAIFDQKITGYGDNLWPGDLSDMRERWEQEVTSTLTIPTIGDIQAYCKSWTERAAPTRQSGVEVDMEFVEDQSQAFLINSIVQVTSSTLKSAGDEFDTQFQPLLDGGTVSATAITRIVPPPVGTIPRAKTFQGAYTQLRERDANVLTKIRAAYQTAITVIEKPSRFADQVLRAAETLITLCQQNYARIQVLKNPLMWERAYAFRRVWSSAVKLRNDLNKQAPRILIYVAPIDTSIGAVSRSIYGDASYASQIMQLNAIPNPLAIRKGSQLRYYDPTSTQRAA
jgi:prophage DNA circulation protein